MLSTFSQQQSCHAISSKPKIIVNFRNIRVTLCKFGRNTENKNEKKHFPIPSKFKFVKIFPIHF